MNKLFKINGNDNVAIALESLAKGEKVDGITLLDDIPFGHKVLLKDMKSGENIIKYNEPIGHLTRDCKAGIAGFCKKNALHFAVCQRL